MCLVLSNDVLQPRIFLVHISQLEICVFCTRTLWEKDFGRGKLREEFTVEKETAKNEEVT
jgi:hypothetical protein